MGAALLRKPSKLAKMVHGIACASPLPITVKIRTGENDKRINAPRVVKLLEAAGAAAVSIHGRTMEQRCAADDVTHVGVGVEGMWPCCIAASCRVVS